VPIVLKSGSLNFLEPLGPVQACNGIALPLIVFQYISNKVQRYTVYLCLEAALHVSDGTSTHHQERMQMYLQHLLFVTPLLLSAAIVEELEPV